MPERKENVVYKQKNVFVNRMSCANVESLSHIENIILFFLKTSYTFVLLSHSNYLMLICNKLGIFSKICDAYFVSSQIIFNYKAMYHKHDCWDYWMQLFVS